MIYAKDGAEYQIWRSCQYRLSFDEAWLSRDTFLYALLFPASYVIVETSFDGTGRLVILCLPLSSRFPYSSPLIFSGGACFDGYIYP